jgi:hypothetical protein
MWSAPANIAPKYQDTAAGLTNTGSALAAIVWPWAAGYVTDMSGDGYLRFLMSMGLPLPGGFSAFPMHPEMPLEEGGVITPVGGGGPRGRPGQALLLLH